MSIKPLLRCILIFAAVLFVSSCKKEEPKEEPKEQPTVEKPADPAPADADPKAKDKDEAEAPTTDAQ
jgi:hypothetical protein